MTAIITNGGTNDTGNTSVTGKSRAIVSGTFTNGASVVFELTADSLTPGRIATLNRPGLLRIDSSDSDNVKATIRNGDANTSIDVSVTSINA